MMMRKVLDGPMMFLLLLLVAAGVSPRGRRPAAAADAAFAFTHRSRIGRSGSPAAASAAAAAGGRRARRKAAKPAPTATTAVVLSSSSSSQDDGAAEDENDDEYGYGPGSSSSPPDLTIDFRLFLTQRAVQSFMFLLSQTRDMYTVRWLDEFTQPVIPTIKGSQLSQFEDGSTLTVDPFAGEAGKGGLLKPGSRLLMYHGLDALNRTLFPTWETYFRQLLDRPSEILEISSGNPGTPFRTFDVDVDPARLCSRLLAVRSQIANEWSEDLGFLANMTAGRVLSSYWENVKKNNGTTTSEEGMRGAGGFDREGLWFLEYISSAGGETDFSPSPLRKGNFDLLKLLATQEGVHRVLSSPSPFASADSEGEMESGADDGAAASTAAVAVSKEFLRNFYLERLGSHFRGYKGYGRADDFIEELMLSPPRLVASEEGAQRAGNGGEAEEAMGPSGLVDPLRLAEAVLKERERVAEEWREVAGQAPSEHVEIQKLQLDRMHNPVQPQAQAQATEEEEEERGSSAVTHDEDGGSWQ